jgi:putative hemolysin
MEEIIKVIDVEKVIRNSKSKLIRSLPKFIVSVLIKFIHQDEMNTTIHKYHDQSGVPFVNSILNEWNVKVNVKGGENVPASGRFVFVANHPLGGIDALSFLSTIYRFYPNVISPSNELFNYIPQLQPLILGINVFGKNTRETIDKLNQLFDSDSQIMIFPAGEVSRKTKGEISDPVWQKTFVTKSIDYKRNIIPVHISGKNSGLFYFVANMRKLIGIKLYIETILLPREMLRQKRSTVTLKIGEPVPWQNLTGEKSPNSWAQYLKELTYKLADS